MTSSSIITQSVYSPAEDSYLLAAAVEQYAHGKVLDMGTGRGLQAITAAKKREVKSVVAADVSEDALKHAAATAKKENAKIKTLKSNLFSNVRGKFDTIIFNPPYLPEDKGIKDDAIYGGRHGYETLQRFIGSCREFLKDSGIILIVFSSRTNRQKVDEAIERSCLEFEELEQKHLFFETLHTYLIRKSQLLLQLQQKGIKGIALFEKGNRGVLYKGSYRGKTVVVKAKRKESAAVATIENETNWLKKLNKEGIGPKLLIAGKGWFAYEFVDGGFITDFIGTCKDAAKVKDATIQMLQQCRKLDEMGVNKEEMLRPQKHVLIGKSGKVTMLDFERCRKTQKPKNVTQLCQFLAGNYANSMLRQKEININREELLAAAQQYKHSQNEENFKKIWIAVLGADRK
ncbi:methyltransferase [Candidatus Woesearchaeota archaeon]|nr:methyltransferase [Candidatus Woesearchaeota archaeon]